MNIRELQIADIETVADLHLAAFKFFFLTSLGKSFLTEFYKSIIQHPSGIAMGGFADEKLVAFAVGTRKKEGFYSSMILSNFFRLSITMLPVVLKNPTVVIRILKSLLTKDSADEVITNHASLLSICVSSDYSDKGIGGEILQAFEKEVFLGSKGISLTTDAIQNEKVNQFYRKNGYLLISEFKQGNRAMNLYYKVNYEQAN